jgi:hypothetical protein
MICSSLVKSSILRSLMYFLIMFYDELIPFQKKNNNKIMNLDCGQYYWTSIK